MIYFLVSAAIAAAIYQVLALVAAFRHMWSEEPVARTLPPVSILKPVKGLDPHFYQAIRSHAFQDYPEFEILFGAGEPGDPAVREIERLAAERPDRQIRLLYSSRKALNGKVGMLAELAAAARYPILLVSDSDIRVPADYLRRVVAPLENPLCGLVTCLYRPSAERRPGRWEAIGIATDFAPSVLAARLIGVSEFALGSTLVFRADELERIGGFQALADYLADDCELARRLTQLGLRVSLSRVVVETHLAGDTWREVWRHQLRWARTIRLSRPGGYLGLPVTQASLWSLLLTLHGLWWLALALVALRLVAGLVVGIGLLRARWLARYFWLIPLRDLWGFGVWLAGLFGDTVVWRDLRLRLNKDGWIVAVEPVEKSPPA